MEHFFSVPVVLNLLGIGIVANMIALVLAHWAMWRFMKEHHGFPGTLTQFEEEALSHVRWSFFFRSCKVLAIVSFLGALLAFAGIFLA